MKIKQKDIMLLVIFLTVAIVPLIAKVAVVERTIFETALLGYEKYHVDTFSFYKSRFIIASGVLLSLIFINEAANRIIRGHSFDFVGFIKKPVNAAMFIYIAAVVLSTIFSPYKELVFKGSQDRYEGFFVVISYCLIIFSVMYSTDTEKKVEFLFYGLFFSALIVGIIGLMQFFGNDPFKMEKFQQFMIGNAGAKQNVIIKDYTINFPTVFSTLYNPNCVGLYSSMIFMITASLAALLPIKSILKYVAAALAPIMMVIVVGSYSLAGIIGSIAGMIAFLIIYVLFIVSHKVKIKVEIIVAATVVVMAATVFTQTTYFKSGVSALAKKANWALLASTDSKTYNHIKITDNLAEVSTVTGDFFIKYDLETDAVLVMDSDKNIVEPTKFTYDEENGKSVANYTFDSIKGLKIERKDNVFTLAYIGFFSFGIYYDSIGTITAVSPAGQPFDINKPIPSIGFENMQSIANGRGYIWSKSLPLIFDNLFIGKGPDSFILQFPQNDVVGKTNFYKGDSNIIIDKPHNMYIQYAVNTGFVSLIALLTVFVIYLVNTIKSVVETASHNIITPMQIGVFSGISAYLVVSLSTDSAVSVAPIFWCILGLGFAINNIKAKIHFKEEEKYVKDSNNKRK